MKLNWKWILGIVLVLAVLFALPFIWRLVMPFDGYNMMGYGYGFAQHMPMMRGYGGPMMGGPGYGFSPLGMVFGWLIQLGVLTLIVLGIIWLVKQLTAKPS